MDPHHDHSHGDNGRCTKCGGALLIERDYKTPERMFQWLLVAVAENMGISAYRRGRRNSSTITVAGPDAATLDRLDARVRELFPLLDAELAAVTRAFVVSRLGIDPTSRK